MTEKLTHERLHEVLDYNGRTGLFHWLVSPINHVKIGDIAGCVSPNGYRYIGIDYVSYKASRLAWFFMEGYWPENFVDHENRNKSDDRWDNLRHITGQCNNRNSGNPCTNTSGVKGVSWSKQNKKWYAGIKVNQKSKHLGHYKCFHNAVLARLAGEQCLGWEGCDSSSPAYQYALEHKLIKQKDTLG